MIEQQTVNGRPAVIAYLTFDMQPTDEKSAELIKLIFTDNHETLWLLGDAAEPLPEADKEDFPSDTFAEE